MSKHPKQTRPSDVDLARNPLIGGSKGVTMAQATPEDLEEVEGVNTIEGDVENDTTPEGGVEKAGQSEHRASRKRHADRAGKPRRPVLQGKKTHEQQLRMLERKPDVPDARQVELEIARLPESASTLPKRSGRQSEFVVSRGGMNQESKHNKHNR